jgi:hypothetical protein
VGQLAENAQIIEDPRLQQGSKSEYHLVFPRISHSY